MYHTAETPEARIQGLEQEIKSARARIQQDTELLLRLEGAVLAYREVVEHGKSVATDAPADQRDPADAPADLAQDPA